MAAETKYLKYVASVDETEALAVLEGLCLAMEAGISPIQLDADSLRVFNLLNREDEDLSKTSSIVQYAKLNSSESLHATYKFTKRDGNVVAHILVRRALMHHEQAVWMRNGRRRKLREQCLDTLP